MTPLAVTAYTGTSAMGSGLVAQLDALKRARGGLRPNDFGSAPLTCWIGRVDGVGNIPVPDPITPIKSENIEMRPIIIPPHAAATGIYRLRTDNIWFY